MQQLIAGRGLQEGINTIKDKTILATTGFAQIQAVPGSSTWADARYIAYAEAEMQARLNIARMLQLEIASGRASSLFSNSGLIEDLANPEVIDGAERLAHKVAALAEAEVDAALIERGVDPAQFTSPEAKKEMLRSQFDQQTLRCRSGAARLFGVCCYRRSQ